METSRKLKAMLASNFVSAGYSAADVRSAGYSAAALRSAGYSAADVLSAGYSAADVRSAGYSAADVQAIEDSIPLVENPYSKMLSGIRIGQRQHKQSTFGPDCDPATNLCKTAMCTAGHLVQMGGELGYKLKDQYNFPVAARMIHYKAHPDWPCQDFGSIRQDIALAYIEEMAMHEEAGTSPLDDWK